MITPREEPTEGDQAFEITPSAFNIAPTDRETLRGVARRTIGKQLDDKVDASDVVQESLAAAWTARGEFRGENRRDFFGWLKTIVKNRALNALRFFYSQRRQLNRETRGSSDQGESNFRDEHTPSQSAIRREDAARVLALLEKLPDAERSAVSMRYLENLPLEQIAARLRRSPAASAGVLKRGMKRLREFILTGEVTEKGHGP